MTALDAGPPIVGDAPVLRVRLDVAYRELARERDGHAAARAEIASLRAEADRLRLALGLAPLHPKPSRAPATMD